MSNANQSTLRRRRRHVRDAVVLVAGRGSRLAPITDTMPKCLVVLDEEPLVVRLLRQLADAGVHRAWMVVGYRSDDIRDALAGIDGLPELHWVQNDTWDTFNNAESVRCGMAAMPAPEPFLICDGDVYVRDATFLRELASDTRPNVLGVELRLWRDLDAEDMKFQLEPVDVPWYSRRVIGLGKGLGRHWCHGESIGFQVVGDESFEALEAALDALTAQERKDLYYEDVFARLIEDGHEFYTHAVQPEAWIEIDTPEDLESARAMFGAGPKRQPA